MAKGGVRYTSSKVREAIFAIIGNVEGTRVLDLFAGSGCLAIEALSRGASSATAVEADGEMTMILEKNLASLNVLNCCRVLVMDVLHGIPFLAREGFMYDIIFADPPYEKGYVDKTLRTLEQNKIYHPGTLVVLEHSKREVPTSSALAGWCQVDSKNYGDTMITLLNGDPKNCCSYRHVKENL